VRWTWGQTNATTLEEGINNKTIFMNWWNNEVITADPVTCSDSLLLYPGTLATPNYRNVYIPPPQIPAGWGVYNIAIFAEVPDMVFPRKYLLMLEYCTILKFTDMFDFSWSRTI
jgi:hypothetical protein